MKKRWSKEKRKQQGRLQSRTGKWFQRFCNVLCTNSSWALEIVETGSDGSEKRERTIAVNTAEKEKKCQYWSWRSFYQSEADQSVSSCRPGWEATHLNQIWLLFSSRVWNIHGIFPMMQENSILSIAAFTPPPNMFSIKHVFFPLQTDQRQICLHQPTPFSWLLKVNFSLITKPNKL